MRRNENDLVDKIEKHAGGTMKEIIIDLAESMEQRFLLLDPMLPPTFAISQISSDITRILKSLHCPIADVVRRYLPDKYKNDNMKREVEIIESLTSIIEHCGLGVRKSVKDCTNSELESQLEYCIKASKFKDNLGTQLNQRKLELRTEALARGIGLQDEKYRDQISARDYRYEIPEYFGLKELNQEVVLQGNRLIDAISRFVNEKYPDCPAVVRQDAYKYAHCFRVWANTIFDVTEDKYSGEDEFWYDRAFWKHVQSSHEAGNSTMFPTTLCAQCSKDIKDDPKDFHRMKYWRPSPTGFICDNCGGTKILERENTREQVGDKAPNVLRDAADLLNHAVYYSDIFMDWRNRFKNPEIYARKAAISEPFRVASLGKEVEVIPRRGVKKKLNDHDIRLKADSERFKDKMENWRDQQ